MIPYIDVSNLQVGGARVHLFGVLMAIAVIVGHLTLVRRARERGIGPPREVEAFAVVTVGAGMLVAYLEGAIRGGGVGSSAVAGGDLSSMKGFAAAAIAGGVFLRARRLDGRRFADLAAYALPFAWFFARLGCALAHDHLGRPSSSWLAVRFPSGPRLDMGLLEWLLTPFLIALVIATGRKSDRPGAVAGALSVVYAIARFLLDFLRADDLGPRSDPRLSGLTAAQWGSGALLLVGISLLITSGPADQGAPQKTEERARGVGGEGP